VQPEAQLSQIEIGTPICRTLTEVRAELVRLRREVIAAAAAKNGNRYRRRRDAPALLGRTADYAQRTLSGLMREIINNSPVS